LGEGQAGVSKDQSLLFDKGGEVFGIEKFIGAVGLANFIFCSGVSIIVLVLPLFIYRARLKLKQIDKQPR
jgi:hypothetical protein